MASMASKIKHLLAIAMMMMVLNVCKSKHSPKNDDRNFGVHTSSSLLDFNLCIAVRKHNKWETTTAVF